MKWLQGLAGNTASSEGGRTVGWMSGGLRAAHWLVALAALGLFITACGAPADEQAGETQDEQGDDATDEVEATEEPPEADTDSDQEVESVELVYAYGGGVIGSSEVGLYLPHAIGCYDREGLDVEVIAAGGSRDALALLIGGNAQIITVGPDTIPQAVQEGVEIVTVYERVTSPNQILGIPADSDIQGVADLEGHVIGVPSMTANQVFYTNALLTAEGLDPERDVDMVPTGFGGAEVAQALTERRVDAITYWAPFFANLENEGFEFRYYQWEGLSNAPGYVMATSRAFLEDNPDVVAAVGRCEAQAATYAFENPEATINAYWDVFPDTKPADMSDEEALSRQLNIVAAQLDYMEPDADHGWGYNDPDGWARYIEFMASAGLLEEEIPSEAVYTNELVEQFNMFDEEEVKSMAQQGFDAEG